MKKIYAFTLVVGLLCLGNSLHSQWSQVSNMPSSLHHPVTWGINDTGYVVTGTNSGGAPTDVFYRYIESTDTWQTLSDFPGQARGFSIGYAYNGKGYLGFGATTSQYLNDLWEYDASTDTWTELTSCPCAGRRHPAFVVREGKVYIGLGDGATGNRSDWWIYDIDSDTWTQGPFLPGPTRHHPFQFKAGNHVYAGMGHGSNGIYKDWYEFDVVSESWTKLNDFPGEARVAGTQFDYGDKGYVLSGDGDNHSFMQQGEFYEYDPANDSWTSLPPHPGLSRWAPGSFVLGRNVYFMGGLNRQTQVLLNDVWTYELDELASVADRNRPEAISIYPNPANDEFRFTGGASIVNVQISNALGQQVNVPGVVQNTVSIQTLKPGVYVVRATDNTGKDYQARLIKR